MGGYYGLFCPWRGCCWAPGAPPREGRGDASVRPSPRLTGGGWQYDHRHTHLFPNPKPVPLNPLITCHTAVRPGELHGPPFTRFRGALGTLVASLGLLRAWAWGSAHGTSPASLSLTSRMWQCHGLDGEKPQTGETGMLLGTRRVAPCLELLPCRVDVAQPGRSPGQFACQSMPRSASSEMGHGKRVAVAVSRRWR